MEKLAILKSYTYESYLQLSEDLLKNNGTTGDDQSEEHIKYTALNHTRMERWNKILQLSEELKQTLHELKNKMEWVVISESWCGDSAQIIPVLAKMEQESAGKITLKIILRDEHPKWIEKYHTDGKKSIPKLIAFDEAGNELFVWGPRTTSAIQLFKDWKAQEATVPKSEFQNQLHLWYARNKGQEIMEEINTILKKL